MSEITIKDVARICGVGVSTVSRALNNHPDINPETRDKILSVIKENNYIPNNSARNLKRQDAKAIAVLVKGIDNSFFNEMIKDMEAECKKKKYSLVLHHVGFMEDQVDTALELVKEKRLRGIVFLGGYFENNEKKLEQLHVPFVLSTAGAVPTSYSRNLYSSVCVDDEKESYKMTDYLIRQGHRNIAIIYEKGMTESISMLRLRGYQRALSDHGIPVREELMLATRPDIKDFSLENGYAVTKDFLQKKIECTAIYAISDIMAIGAGKALAEEGLRVPEDMSLAGFDGVSIGGYVNPSLTTIKQPGEKIAQETMRLLFDMILKKAECQHKIFDGELVVRGSTRCI